MTASWLGRLTATLFALHLLGVTTCAQTQKLPDFDRRTPVVLAVENVGPAVVNIRTQNAVSGRHLWSQVFNVPSSADPDSEQMYRDRSLGSGVIIHPDGYVLTNEHVIQGADLVLVGLAGRKEPVRAEVVSLNSDSDLAVLLLDAAHAPYPVAALGDSDTLMVGETTIALGNPFGLESTVTAGILSAKNRTVTFQGREIYKDFLQTSSLINPGNSGGPLLDVNGRVIGINVAIDSRGPGIGYAIPINRARDVATSLIDPEIIRDAWLGFDVEDDHGRIVVKRVYDDGPAAKREIVPGSQILAVDGKAVGTGFDFHAAVLAHAPGTTIALTVENEGKRMTRSVAFQAIALPSLRDQVLKAYGMICRDLDDRTAVDLGVRHVAAVVAVRVDRDGTAAKVDLRPGDLIYQVGRFKVSKVTELARVLAYYARRGSAKVWVYRRTQLLQGTMVF